MSCPCSASSSTNVSTPAVSPSITRSQQPEERVLLDGAEQLEHGRHRDLASRRGRELVERRDGVPEAPAGASRDEGERRLGSLDALAVRDSAKQPRQLAESGPFEHERLAARPDRREHLREVGRAEDEDEMGRRLLDQLQQGVEGGVRELVRLVEDVDLVASLDRLEDDVLADLADVVDAPLGRSVHLDHVERCPRGDRAAGVALVAGGRGRALRAVERLGDDPGERGLTGSARAGEEVRLADEVALDRIAKRSHHRLLPDDLVEVERAGTCGRARSQVHATRQVRASPVAHLPSKARPGRCRRRSLGPGCSAAPRRLCLALLPPGPDAVRRLPSRGTWPSTLTCASPYLERLPPREGIQPRCSGLRVQGTASSPPSATGLRDGSSGGLAILAAPGRIAQRESARLTRGRSLVQIQLRPLGKG